MKVRTIITQDAEVDDQNSLRHFLLYANEVELEGIVQTSSKFHWQGVKGASGPKTELARSFLEKDAPYSEPYRWPGTDWMYGVIDDYAIDYPNLKKRSEGYPTPEYLRTITKVGNIGYMGEVEHPTEGSELIRRAILAEDARKLYIQVWGGCNTIARALMDIEAEYKNTPQWEALRGDISQKVVLTACGEQDETYRSYISEQWPGIQFVKTLQMGSYAYPWKSMPEGESKDTLGAEFMRREILSRNSALIKGYCTWLDGHYYEGEEMSCQFGANPDIMKEWFGIAFGLPEPEKNDFLSEGDSPTYFPLFDWGFRTLEDFSNGGIAGRYRKVTGEANSRGEALNYWDVTQEADVDKAGKEHLTESMWRYTADIQRDFASRAAWASGEYEGHAPRLRIAEGLDFRLAPGEALTLHAEAEDAEISFRIYPEASAGWAKEVPMHIQDRMARITIPGGAVSGDHLHIIVKARSKDHYRLTHYQQVIIEIK